MSIVKGVLAGAMALALGLMWSERAWVTSPYTDKRDELEFTLDGLDLTIEPTELGPSPFVLSAAADTSAVELPVSYPVPPPPREPADMNGGTATLGGTVLTAGSPIEGAIVRLERAVLDDSSSLDLSTDDAGQWKVTGLRGGRYRVRAFIPGEFASESSAVLFVDEGSTHEVVTPVVVASEDVALRFFGPEEILVGGSSTIAVTSVAEAVDADGRLVLSPFLNPWFTASVNGPASLLSADVVASDVRGTARFLIQCDYEGRGLLTVEITSGETSSFILPPCVAALAPVEPNEEAVDE